LRPLHQATRDRPGGRAVRGRHQGQLRRARRVGRPCRGAAARRLHRRELPRRSIEAMTAIRTETIVCGGMPAFVAVPDGAAKVPAVLVVHERYGLVRHTCELAERFARDGYVAIAPDLYHKHPDQEALHRGDANCDVNDPDALIALGSTIDALQA